MPGVRLPTFIGLGTAVAAVLVCAGARATEYDVSPTGSDTASGLSGAPWLTIQRALKTVKPGDVVTVEDGTYAGLACDTVSGTASAPIVFRSRNKWGAKITSATADSSQDFVQLSSCSYVTIDGFEVSGAPRSGIAILGNTDDGSDARGVVIQNCYSHNNGGTTVSGRHDGIFSGFALDLTIQDNRIDTTGEHGIYVSNAADNPAILRNNVSNTGANCIQINADLSTGGDGLISNWRIEGNTVQTCNGAAAINLDGAINGVAANNVIFNAAKGGFTLFQGDGAEASHDNLIVNNTVYNPNGSRSAIQIADGANNNVVFNNIFVAKSAAFEVQSVTGLMHDYNVVSGYDGTTAAAHESTPSNAASLFVDASSGNLQLAAVNPPVAIDKGVASFGGQSAPTTDLTGAPRPAGAGYDIGAYESGSTPPATGAGGSPAATGGSTGSAGGSTGSTGGAAATGGSSGSTGGTGAIGAVGTTGAGGSTGASGGAPGGKPPQMSQGGGCGCRTAGAGSGRLALEIVTAPVLFLVIGGRRRHRRKSSGAA